MFSDTARFLIAIRRIRLLILCAALSGCTQGPEPGSTPEQLLRHSYWSTESAAERDYFVYLPNGYAELPGKQWPVILFLHGNGQRGDGRDDLDFVLRHGPLMEAWVQRRNLPFIIISPQLQVLGQQEAVEDRKNHIRPRRLAEGTPERNYGFPSDWPIQRTGPEKYQSTPISSHDYFSKPGSLPVGWNRIDSEIITIVDAVLHEYAADPARVYLAGLSLGGFGVFDLAVEYPERWAAVVAVAASGTEESEESAATLSKERLPIWIVVGGKDSVVSPYLSYETARALETAEHPALRFTVHEDMDHDVWKRVFEGDDVYRWLLEYRSDDRPSSR